jgi:excisionase family DNA binding protein
MSFRCDRLDAAIAEEVLKALQPAELELALAALRELQGRDQALMHQWQMRLERAEYEAALAERRYQEVDPSNRLVASTLERRWNDALVYLDEVKKQVAEFQGQEPRVATPEQKAKVLALAQDLPRLWHAPSTQARDRKRMLRLLIKDITVEKPLQQKQLLVHIRWQGGACTNLSVQLPPNIADRLRYPAAIVERVRELARDLPDAQIAERLNQEALVSANGQPFTASMLRWIRYAYQIPAAKLMRADELTVQQAAERLAVSSAVVYSWIDRGFIQARQLNSGRPYWITLSESDEQKLRDWVRNSKRLRAGKPSLDATGESAL